MGLELLSFLKNKVPKEQKIAFIGTFFISLLIHLYKFANTLPNLDSPYNYYSDQNVLGSGRWALSIACGMSSYFDLPWVIGIFSCLFIALTVVVIVALFKVENPVLIALIGGLLAASPSTTETFFFLYTSDGYMIAMFLAALAIYLSRIGEKRVLCWLLSGVCICVSCGIYQAYVSFALILGICYFMYELFQNNHKQKEYYSWICRQVCIFSCSLAAYYLIWKICMHTSGTFANDYQGISKVGTLSIGLLLNGVVSSVKTFVLYFLQRDVLEYGFTLYAILNLLFSLVFLGGLVIAIKESKILSRRWAFFLVILCLVAIVPFSCIWHFVSSSVGYRALMLQSLTILFVFTALTFERWSQKYIKGVVGAFLLVIVLNNALMANISYYYMNLCYERTYADGLEMILEIHDRQNTQEVEKIAVIGNRLAEVQWENFDDVSGGGAPAGKIHILSGLISTNLLIDHEHTVRYLNATYGLELTSATKAERELLTQTEIVANMPCWPAGDSMCVIDGTLVIKLADSE